MIQYKTSALSSGLLSLECQVVTTNIHVCCQQQAWNMCQHVQYHLVQTREGRLQTADTGTSTAGMRICGPGMTCNCAAASGRWKCCWVSAGACSAGCTPVLCLLLGCCRALAAASPRLASRPALPAALPRPRPRPLPCAPAGLGADSSAASASSGVAESGKSKASRRGCAGCGWAG